MNRIKTLIFALAIAGLLSACSSTQKKSQSSRTAIEQLLLSESVTRSLPSKLENPLPILAGSGISIDSSGISPDQHIVRQVLAGWLGQLGYHIMNDIADATYRISIIVESLGTETGDTFLGLPPIQGTLIPISLPELTLFKAQFQTGYTKFYLNIYELQSGQLIQSTPSFVAETYYDYYTFLFLFSFVNTNLKLPPQVGFLRKNIVSPLPH